MTSIATAITLALISSASIAQDLSRLADESVALEQGYTLDSGFVANKGYHYWLGDPRKDPVFCIYKGKITCIEYTFTPEEFAAGKSWSELPRISGLSPLDHVALTFEPKGHAVFPGPLYMLRIFFATPEELAKMR